MEIRKLINIYEKLIPIYENNKFISYGICAKALRFTGNEVFNLFHENGYYKNYMNSVGIYLEGPSVYKDKGRKFRIQFMKNEIVELNELLKQGYTDV